MTESLDIFLAEFDDELNRINNLIELIHSLRKFGSIQIPDNIGEESKFISASVSLHEHERKLSTDIPILSGTILLYTVGQFENFVRSIFEVYCDEIASRCKKFTDLPEKMRNKLISQTAEVLLNPTRYGFDKITAQSLVKNLAKNLEATDGLGEINSSCLSITNNNMRSTTLKDLFNRVGITQLWNEISKQHSLKKFFESNSDNEVKAMAENMLDNIMNIRNQIAHPSSNPTFPDAEQMKKYIKFLKYIAKILIDICEMEISTFKQSN